MRSKQDFFPSWVTAVGVVASAACIYFGGLPGLVIGVAIALYLAIVLTILARLHVLQLENERGAKGQQDEPDTEDEPQEFSFNLPEHSPNAWNAYTVYPTRQLYENEYCHGGPPNHNETWQYEVKGEHVFHRLTDANTEYFDNPIFEVINGTISEEGITEDRLPDYVSTTIERRRREIQWHECRGVVALEILAIHFRAQPSRARQILSSKQKTFVAAFAEMEKKLVALGALEQRDGDRSYFVAPEGASEDVKKQISDIQDNKQKSKYSDSRRITFQDFYNRKVILGTLERLLAEPQQDMSAKA